MQQVQDQLDFDIETPDDEELKRRFFGETQREFHPRRMLPTKNQKKRQRRKAKQKG